MSGSFSDQYDFFHPKKIACLIARTGDQENRATLYYFIFLALAVREPCDNNRPITFPAASFSNVIFALTSGIVNCVSETGSIASLPWPVICPNNLSPSLVIVRVSLGVTS